MTGGFYMDALITPARSLPRRGRYWVLAVSIGMALMPVAVFTLIGEPVVLWFIVPPFLSLDIFGLWFAFHVMNRRVDAERVRVSSDFVEVFRSGKAVWSSAERPLPGSSRARAGGAPGPCPDGGCRWPGP